MKRLLGYAGLGMVLCIGACAAEGKQTGALPVPSDDVHQQAEYVPREVVVRLCAGVTARRLAAALKKHRLREASHASPEILTLGWKDDRSVEQVVSELKGSRLFCIAQPNYLYQVQPAVPGSPQ